jgi:hypothetical protein
VVPLFAISLVLLVSLSYFASIRSSVVAPRWCHGPSRHSRCLWLPVHDALVLYFTGMILFHFLSATFASPGVALPVEDVGVDDVDGSDDSPTGVGATPEQQQKQRRRQPQQLQLHWSAAAGQGGFWGCNPAAVDRAAERNRVELYFVRHGAAGNASGANANANRSEPMVAGNIKPDERHKEWYPSTEPTWCDKCSVLRPPRCHHCSQCDRCVLQFDHHCVWLNNCVGYNN